MSYTFPKSEQLYDRAKRSIAGGVNSGIRGLEKPVPLYFTHGKGSRLWDVDGNEFIDFMIGQGALLFGHAPEGLTSALARQAGLGTHWAAQSELEIEVAERLQAMIPSAELVRFNSSATELKFWVHSMSGSGSMRRRICLAKTSWSSTIQIFVVLVAVFVLVVSAVAIIWRVVW
jgi:glutamate-1-semialdehyde aminotransferase